MASPKGHRPGPGHAGDPDAMRVAAIGLALAAALLVAGCGNGNTTPGGGNASPGGNAPSVFPSVQTDDETLPPGDQPTASPADPGGAPVAT